MSSVPPFSVAPAASQALDAATSVDLSSTTQPRAAALGESARDGSCAFEPIVLRNRRPTSKSISVEKLKFKLRCTPTGSVFGVSAYQSDPLLSPVTSTKLGDITVTSGEIVFKPVVQTLVLAANSTTTIAIIGESSTAAVALPVTPNVPTLLTSNAPTVPPITLTYDAASGANVYGASCFPAFDASGTLASDLQGRQLLGIPKAYCLFDTPGGSVTFGTAPRFDIDFSKIDGGLLLLDGPIRTDPCAVSGTSESCTTSTFTIGTGPTDFQRAIIGNVADLAACVPAKANADCNAATNPAPSATSLRAGPAFQLLVANDKTYVGPAFGGYRLSVSPASAGVCALDIGRDDEISNPDFPAGYYDPQAATGATSTLATYPGDPAAKTGSAEFDVFTSGSGTCAIDVTETTGLKRTFHFSVPVG